MTIELRPWKPEDAPAFMAAYGQDPDLHAQFGGADPSTVDQARDLISLRLTFADSSRNRAITIDGVAVGDVGLSAIERTHETEGGMSIRGDENGCKVPEVKRSFGAAARQACLDTYSLPRHAAGIRWAREPPRKPWARSAAENHLTVERLRVVWSGLPEALRSVEASRTHPRERIDLARATAEWGHVAVVTVNGSHHGRISPGSGGFGSQ